MAVLLTLNLSCAQPGEGHPLNLTTARPFLTLVEIVAATDFLGVPEGIRDHFLQQPLRLLQIARVETFGQLCSKVRARAASCPVAPEPREARGGAEFLTLVTTSDCHIERSQPQARV